MFSMGQRSGPARPAPARSFERSATRTRVFVVHPDPFIRHGLRNVLGAAGDVCVSAEAGTAAEAVGRVRDALAVDVVLLAVPLPDGCAAAVCADLCAGAPDVRVLALSGRADDPYVLPGHMAEAAA